MTLQSNHQMYRSLFENMLNGFAYCRMIFEGDRPLDFIYLDVNRAFEVQTGLKNVVGRRVSEVIPGIREADPELFEIYGRVARTGRPERFETYVAALSMWFEIAVYSPEADHFVAVFDVITKRKRAEAEREKLQAQFLQSQKMESIGRLASGVAHDFNNVLTVITANLNLIQGDRRPECPHAELLDEIRDAAERAADLTRQLLAFSRQNINQMRPENLNEVIRKTRRMLERVIGEDVRFELTLSAESIFCRLDVNQIEQIFVNLAVNARDAMPRGGTFRLETAIVRHDGKMEVAPRDGFVARVSASDTGTGIAIENLSRIFEPFFTTKELGKGTGLGLAMAYGIVKQHGGDIVVRSEIGKGTTFEIFLPLCVEEDAKPVRKPVSEEVRPGEAPTVAATILLVEDEAAVRRVTKRALEKIGYRVIEAVGPDEALERASDPQLEIDLVLSDIVMPGMDGLELMKRIREIRPGIESLFMSGYAEKEIQSRISADSTLVFLPKPFTVDELARKVRSVLGGNEATARLIAASRRLTHPYKVI